MTPRVSTDVNYGLWMRMMWHVGPLIVTNVTTLEGILMVTEATYVGAGDINI